MKILFIGGTGTISSAISEEVLKAGHHLYLLNRGNRNHMLTGNVTEIIADVNDEDKVREAIKDLSFDVVADFIGFTKEHVERDFSLFHGKTKQYIYISSASAYEKPVKHHIITEETPLDNPYWEYSRHKIACEEYLMEQYKKEGFPVTIIRPSHTYDHRKVPTGVHGRHGSWQIVKRIMEGKPTIIHGDGTSLWTMTHAKDFAKGFVGILGNTAAIGEVFHITSDESLTWNQIYEAMAEALGVKLNPFYVSSNLLAKVSDYDIIGSLIGDKANTVVFDNSKIKKFVPEFHATISFKEGIKECIDYILAHKELQVEDMEYELWADKLVSNSKIIIELMKG